MHVKALSLVTDPQPGDHIVYPYTDDDHLAEVVALYAGSGITKGEAVVLITTEPHREAIEQRLLSQSVNLALLKRTGNLVFIDADRVLSQLMVDGMPDENLFRAIADGLILRAKADTDSGRFRQVRLFGEMVNLLWENQPAAALRLEELWNGVIEAHCVPLLCAYSLHGQENGRVSTKICGTHSHTLDSQVGLASAQ